MNEISKKLIDRAAKKSAKREEKRRQIASSAVEALTQLGYANTAMRDIAALSDMSLGMLHYYFADKSDLIVYCVRGYKTEFVAAMKSAVDAIGSDDDLIDTFALALAATVKGEAALHRLWYDIRTQAMFDEAFRPAIDEIEDSLIAVIRAVQGRLGYGPDEAVEGYAVIDGLFRYWVQDERRLAAASVAEIAESFGGVLSRLWSRRA